MDQDKITAYITGNISDEDEKAKIREWISQANENKQLFYQLKSTFALSRKSSGTTDVNQEYLKLKHKDLIREKVFIPYIFRYAAVILITIGLTLFIRKQTDHQNTDSYQMNQVICPAGQISELVLSDGTRVWLNAGSSISYPSRFDKGQRSVYLKGEAFFEVKKDKKNPFLVETDQINIKVLGTSFNMDAYVGNKMIKTTLVEGKVEIQNKAGVKLTEMLPGQQAYYDTRSNKIHLSEVDTRFYYSWKEGKMTFLNEPLNEIAAKLERWYNVQFVFTGEDIKALRYSGTFLKYKPLNQILEIIKLSSSIDYSIKINPGGKDEITLKESTHENKR